MVAKLFVFDLDGTLAVEGVIPEPLVKSIQKLSKWKHAVTIITGRGERKARLAAKQLGIALPYAVWNGARIVNANGRLIQEWLVEGDDIAEIVAMSLDIVQEFHIETGTRMYVQQPDPIYWKWAFEAGNAVTAFASYRRESAYKLVMHFETVPPAEWLIACHRRFPDLRFTVVNGRFVEVTRPEAMKGEALKSIAGTLGFTAADLIVFGDDSNDVSMFELAGYRIGVAPKDSRLAELADEIVASPSELGVLQWLERHIFNRKEAEVFCNKK